jgi:hypothetical protein
MTQALTTTREPVLVDSNGGIFKSKLRMHLARFHATPTRIVCFKKSTFWMMFGALGLILSRGATGKQFAELEYSRIASVIRTKHGFNKKVLEVKMDDGATHKITVDKFDEMAAKLREVLGDRCQIAAA